MGRKINFDKIKQLPTANAYLDEKHGKEGTPSREEFNAKTLAYYYGELIKETRKEKNITQKDLAERVGAKREFISKIEKGETDMQLSTFMKILQGLGLSIKIG